MKKTINGIKHDFQSCVDDKILTRYNTYDYDCIYTQVIDGMRFVGVREFRVSPKSGAYHENFVFHGVKFKSELQFAIAALKSIKY